ncbi:RraA family protein [Methanobacterium sp. ACI-7]|uniref:RraA family protein n=1 Tax=unclassified Methanobacterium TaxID=2627676 RepID=UPI0039C305AF
MNNEKKVSPKTFLEKFSKKSELSKLKRLNVTSSQISDALNNLTGNSGVLSGVMPLFDTSIMGNAITVDTKSDDWGTSVNAIDEAKKGEILLIKVDEDDKAIWGELTSKTAKEKGIIATVIYGAVRDVGAIKEMKYPVFSKNIVPNAGKPKAEGEINVKVQCGDLIINHQDIIIGDECGVVVVPKELLGDVIKEALNIKRKEKQIIKDIEEGLSLSSILNLK